MGDPVPERQQAEPTDLRAGVIWNIGSLGFLALAGFVLNIVIGRVYGPDALGVFNIAFALYIFFAQFGSFGLHFSVLQAISEAAGKDQNRVDQAAAQGLLAVSAVSAITVFFATLLTPIISMLFDSGDLQRAWLLILPGLFFFSINKFLFNVINGARHMRTFAVLQAVRYVLVLITLLVLLLTSADPAWLTLTLTVAETVMTPLLFRYAGRVVDSWPWQQGKEWRRKHLFFGARVFLAGAILELNTRVDVLMIGFFLNEERAGVYSVALLIVEGVAQLVFAVKNNINPLLANFAANHDVKGLLVFSRKTVLYFTPPMLLVAGLGYMLFPIFEWIAFGDISIGLGEWLSTSERPFSDARTPLAFLLTGLALSAGFQCFFMILSQANRPAAHSGFVAFVLVANVLANAVMIPTYGILGASLATAVSYIIGCAAIVFATRKVLRLRLVI